MMKSLRSVSEMLDRGPVYEVISDTALILPTVSGPGGWISDGSASGRVKWGSNNSSSSRGGTSTAGSSGHDLNRFSWGSAISCSS